MLVYALITWNLLGGVVVGTAIKNKVKKNEREIDEFMECCNAILKRLTINSCDYWDLYSYCGYSHTLLHQQLKFLTDNALIKYIPESRRYYIIKKVRNP